MRGLVVLLAFLLALPAHAEDKWNCSTTVIATSRSLFTNSGLYATTGGAVNTVQFCGNTQGLYGEVFTSTPFQDFGTGAEVDLRVGFTRNLGGITADASLAFYYFGVGNEYWQTYNARFKFSHEFKVADQLTLTPFAGIDLSWVEPISEDDNAIFGGVALNYNFLPKVNLNLKFEAWHHTNAPDGWDPTVLSVTGGLAFDLNKQVTCGPQVQWTRGGNPFPDDNKTAYQAVCNIKW